MNLRTDIATSRVALKAFAMVKSMGSKGHTLLTIVGLIAIWGICASIIYWVISAFWKIAS